jgi:hypothetical protein
MFDSPVPAINRAGSMPPSISASIAAMRCDGSAALVYHPLRVRNI